jgi:hypothetical protein
MSAYEMSAMSTVTNIVPWKMRDPFPKCHDAIS